MKTIENNKTKYINKKFQIDWEGIPAYIRDYLGGFSMRRSFILSLVIHIIVAFLLWLLAFCIIFFGWDTTIFPKPKKQTKDIEYILKKPILHKAQPSSSTLHTPTESKKPQQVESKKTEITPSKNNKSTNHATKNTNHTNDIPDFSFPTGNFKPLSNGSAFSVSKPSGVSKGNSYSPSISDEDTRANNGSSSHAGNIGGNNSRNIVSGYDISPYVNELKRNIRWNWKPPANGQNKKVELFLRIAKDGKIIILNVKKTSEIAALDNSALSAVRHAEPISPLPSKYNKSFIDIVFIFDSTTSSINSRY